MLVMDRSVTDVEHNAAWLREMRDALGWTTQRVAEEAKKSALDLGDGISMSQQLVSRFENGHLKSSPRWLGYVQKAMLEHMAGRSMAPGRIFELRLPSASAQFFRNNLPAEVREAYDPPDLDGSDEHDEWHRAAEFADNRSVEVPMIDLAYGMGGTYLDDDEPEVRTEPFPLAFIRRYTAAKADKLVFAEGIGDSMAPTIQTTDLLLIDQSDQTLRLSDQIWAFSYGGVGMVKRLRPRPDGSVAILSDNPNVPEDKAVDDELHLIGRVVAKVSKL